MMRKVGIVSIRCFIHRERDLCGMCLYGTLGSINKPVQLFFFTQLNQVDVGRMDKKFLLDSERKNPELN